MLDTFAAVAVALHAAHHVADHWVQTDRQATRKGDPGWVGRRACLAHVTTYTLVALVALASLVVVVGLRLDPSQAATGLAVSAGSHYLVDRRAPLIWMCSRLGKSQVWLHRHNGLYAMDQSWHIGWLFVAALVITA